MSDTEVVPYGHGYVGDVTPLKSGGRSDVHVTNPRSVESFDQDITQHLSRFFQRLVDEIDAVNDDPVALVNALARTEALLADVRFARDHAKKAAAAVLNDTKTRKLTVDGVITVEGTSSLDRSNWEHLKLFAEMLEATDHVVVDRATGEMLSAHNAAGRILEWFRPEWRLKPIRDAGVNPDDWCEVATDDDGRPVRTPTVKIVDNVIRRLTKDLDDAAT